MGNLDEVMRDLVIANRILSREDVVDAFGHVSVRHPDDPERYIMACSRAPGLVVRDDLMEYTLDGDPFDQRDRLMYAERHIHGAIYETRPDVHAVIHNHSLAVIPFGVTGVRLRPVIHVGSTMGTVVPVWDIREKFGDTSLLVLNMEQGRDLAGCLGDGRVALMRGHGCVVGCADVKAAVMVAVYLQVNAGIQMDAMRLGDPVYLSPGEIDMGEGRFFGELGLSRSWEYWCVRAGCEGL
jgi:HCOMODA/2-hydroxy-3-carboxy-muconic semialdehyde decarboxylase